MPSATSNTAYGIISDAYHDAGLIADGIEPNSDQLVKGLRYLCDVINYVQTKGVKLFLNQEITVPLTASTQSYTVNPTAGLVPSKHLAILQAYIDMGTSRRPLHPITTQEWMRLPNNEDGSVVQYWVDKTATSLVVHFWPTPDTTDGAYDAVLLVRTQAVNPINLESDVPFPQEWRLPLRWLLADELCTGQPAEIMKRCKDKADEYRENLEAWDVEDGDVTFAADISQAYGQRSFR